MTPPSKKLPASGVKRSVRRLAEADGVTLVEVLVSALMVGLIGMTLLGLDAAGKTTADQRRRSEATQIAQQDQERIKGLSADQIATLNQTRFVTVDKVKYKIISTGKFISSSAATASCSSTAAAADYARVTSTIQWDSNARSDVVVSSLITPRAGGSVVADVNDQTGAPLAGAAINLSGTDQNTGSVRRRGTSDADGCVIFGALLVGDYTATASRSGYVDPQGSSTPSSDLTATAGNTSTGVFSLGLAGKITANFQTLIGGVTKTGQKVPSMSWNNSGMLTLGSTTPSSLSTSLSTATNLYPFTVAANSYTNNYSVWAGSCSTDFPPVAANQRFATVSPGAAATTTVQLPAMALLVQVQTSSSTTRQLPDHVKLTDSCGQSWMIQGTDINSAGITDPNGVLAFPGQPYSSSYTVCVDDLVGGTAYRRTDTTTNTNFAAATSKTLTIDSRSTSNKGLC